jgi:GAF domain-containing protein
MESFSTFDGMSLATGSDTASAASLEPNTPNAEMQMQRESSDRTSQASISAALAAADAAARGAMAGLRFPGEDGGRSLGEMAKRDLDAALQLLTDRAQYITGSTGAAIALRRNGGNDMQCRASTGSNAPELGALLSTEFGLSGESVRTRRILRCDDAERDGRVNQAVCREMGIASVVVMPVVHDDEVLGVFELFSGKEKAFGERDLTALKRLGEMVETAVTLARTAEGIPAQIETAKAPVAQEHSQEHSDDAEDILEVPASEARVDEVAAAEPAAPQKVEATEVLEANEVPQALPSLEVKVPLEAKAVAVGQTLEPVETQVSAPQLDSTSAESAPTDLQPTTPRPTNRPSANPVPVKKPLLWSAALNVRGDGQKTPIGDQSHVPPAFRDLRKCEACGFPVSAGRALCVECEEKKWRGQLKISRAMSTAAASGAATAVAPAREVPTTEVRKPVVAPASAATTEAWPRKEQAVATSVDLTPFEQKEMAAAAPVQALLPALPEPAQEAAQPPIPTLVLSAGLEPSQSWLARNKYVFVALLVVAGSIGAILLLR